MYLVEKTGEEIADRFLRQAEVTFAFLAEQPEIGAPLTLRPPQLAGLRKWQVHGQSKRRPRTLSSTAVIETPVTVRSLWRRARWCM